LPIKDEKKSYELIYEDKDIYNQNYLSFTKVRPKLIDYSLREYLKAYTLDKLQDF